MHDTEYFYEIWRSVIIYVDIKYNFFDKYLRDIWDNIGKVCKFKYVKPFNKWDFFTSQIFKLYKLRY